MRKTFDPHDFVLSPEELVGNGRTPKTKTKTPPKHQTAKLYAAFTYNRLLELAQATRNPLLAALAELHHLQYRSWEKDKPLTFPGTVFYRLGFDRHVKIRTLEALEKAGWVRVKWRKYKSPLVKIIRGFYFGP